MTASTPVDPATVHPATVQMADGDEPATSELLSYGWLPWQAALRLLGDAHGVWLEPSGVRHATDSWPSALPLTTRLHAWGTGAAPILWRLVPRTASGTVLVTALAGPGADPPGRPAGRLTVAVSRSVHGTWERRWIVDRSAVMFLRAVPGDGDGDA